MKRCGWAGLALIGLAAGTAQAVVGAGALVADEPLAQEHLVAARLPAALFAAADAALRNVWVEDDGGGRVPAVIEPVTRPNTHQVREACGLKQARASLSDDGTALELVYEAVGASPAASGLTVQTPLRDFRRRVRVEGSADGEAWQVRADGTVIYGLERFVDVRQCDVRWTEAGDRWLRVTFLDARADEEGAVRRETRGPDGAVSAEVEVRAQPLPVTRLDFWRETAQTVAGEPVLAEYPVYPHVSGVADGWQVIDLAAGGVPLSTLTFGTDETLFSRRYTLHGLTPDTGKVVETPVAQGQLTQVIFQGVAVTNLTVSFAPRRFEVYRLRLAADAGPPPEVTVVRAEGPAWQVVVPMLPGRRYTLRAGGDTPDAGTDSGRSVLAALRAAGAEPVPGRVEGFVLEAGAPSQFFGRSQMLLMAMLVAGAVLLWCLLRAAKRIN